MHWSDNNRSVRVRIPQTLSLVHHWQAGDLVLEHHGNCSAGRRVGADRHRLAGHDSCRDFHRPRLQVSIADDSLKLPIAFTDQDVMHLLLVQQSTEFVRLRMLGNHPSRPASLDVALQPDS